MGIFPFISVKSGRGEEASLTENGLPERITPLTFDSIFGILFQGCISQ